MKTIEIEQAHAEARAEVDAARDAGDAQAFMAAFEKLEVAEQAREDAIRASILEAAPEATELEAKAVESIVDLFVEFIDHGDTSTEIAVQTARILAQEPLLRKVLAGREAEWRAFETSYAGGIVGRAVDGAVEALRPYWEPKL